MTITWHGEETEDPVIMECDHCGKAISLSSLASQMYSYGVVFLVGKDHGFVGCMCPNQPCSKAILKKMEMTDHTSLKLHLLHEEGPEVISSSRSKVVYDSFPYEPAHPPKKYVLSRSLTQLENEFETLNLSHIDGTEPPPGIGDWPDYPGKEEDEVELPTSLPPNDDRNDPFSYSTYHSGDLAVGPAAAFWWFLEDAIHDLHRLENETGLKSFPRYIVHDPILSAIHSFCWDHRLAFDLAYWRSDRPPMVYAPHFAQKKAVQKNLEFVKLLDTMRLGDIRPDVFPYRGRLTLEGNEIGFETLSGDQSADDRGPNAFLSRERISDAVWGHFPKDHIQKLLSMMSERFISEYINLSRTIHFSYESVWKMKEKYLNELCESTHSKKGRLKARSRLSEEQRKEIAEIEEQKDGKALKDIVTSDYEVNEIKLRCYRWARNKMPDKVFLLIGETGTGKELFAKVIHEASGRKGKLVAVDCTDISENLFESALFGHVRGAFSGAIRDETGLFEQADGGTLFLDEIGDISINLQNKLRRPIEKREISRVGQSSKTKNVDVTIVLATNKDLGEEADKGTFKKDLYHRINSVEIKIPPLRKRKSDILQLARHFIDKYSGTLGNPDLSSMDVSGDALELLEKYNWPGNVRELENVIKKIVATRSNSGDYTEITPADLPPEIIQRRRDLEDHPLLKKDELTAETIAAILKRNNNNFSVTARELGMTPRNFRRIRNTPASSKTPKLPT